MDRHDVRRALIIASVPGDEPSVASALAEAPDRLVGGFMVDAGAPDLGERVTTAFADRNLSTACLFPAMHHVAIDDPRSVHVFDLARAHRRAVFVHCGMLSVGVRAKLGLPSPFDLRLGDPLAVAAVAVRYPEVPVVIPHFGAGLFREALMAARAAPNVLLDTSSSNAWIDVHHELTLRDVFARALDVLGPERLLFGTDSSFFPRGWQADVYERQLAILTDVGLSGTDLASVLGRNFNRLYGS